MSIQKIADRMALKDLVDTFSNLADTKEIDEQVQLFTEDAVTNLLYANVTKKWGQRKL